MVKAIMMVAVAAMLLGGCKDEQAQKVQQQEQAAKDLRGGEFARPNPPKSW